MNLSYLFLASVYSHETFSVTNICLGLCLKNYNDLNEECCLHYTGIHEDIFNY